MKTLPRAQPLVSVVIPCYNHGAYIQGCIESVIAQDYKEIELIIIDDGSQDDSVLKIHSMMRACEDRFVRFEFRSRSNVGLSSTLNEAVEWCVGEFYSAIASDDLMLPTKTSSQVKYLLEHEECMGVFSGVQIIDGSGNPVRQVPGLHSTYNFKDIFLGRSSLPAPTQMLRLKSLRDTGGYPSGLYIEDRYMWLKLTEHGGVLHNMGGVAAAYRRHDTNISSQLQKMEEARVQIVNYFSSSVLYNRGMANAFIQSAVDAQLVDRKRSLSLLKAAYIWSFKDLFQFKVLKYLVKAVIPRKLLRIYFSGTA